MVDTQRAHTVRTVAGALLFIVLLSGCASPYHWQSDRRITSLPPLVELTDVPFFPQERFQCGPAALATVLNYSGMKVSPVTLQQQLYLPKRQGSLQAEMVATARHYDMLVVTLTPYFATLLQELAVGHPVVVLQNLGLSWLPRWHYAVVVGYDLAREELVLRSGAEQRRVTPFALFMRTWQRAQQWAVVALPAGQLPATGTRGDYLTATVALEKTGHFAAAKLSYKAMVERWPEEFLLFMGLGNTAYAMADYEEAQSAFSTALALDPHQAAAWNNLGYALAQRGCQPAARSAAHCAIALAQEERYQESLQEIGRMAAKNGLLCITPRCPVETHSTLHSK